MSVRLRRAKERGGRTAVLVLNTATRAPLGADTAVLLEATGLLDRAEFDVHLACTAVIDDAATPTARLARELPGLTVHHVDLGRERTPGAGGVFERATGAWAYACGLGRTWRLARALGVAVVHANDRPRDALAAVVIARSVRAAAVLHLHVKWDAWMGRARVWPLRHADAVVAVSEFVAASARPHLAPERLAVVPNGIREGRWVPRRGRETTREALGLPADALVVVTACRLFEAKGVRELVHAFAKGAASHPSARLLVVGEDDPSRDGSYGRELVRLVADLGLGDRVAFLGWRDDLPELLAAADVFAMPSFEEPFGLVFVEAMAMELPVVALRSGGAIEVVEHDVSGYLCEPGDAEGLAGALDRLLGDAELRSKMGRRGRELALARFTATRMAADLGAVYRRVLEGGRA